MGHPQVAAFARLADGGTQATRSIAGQKTLFTRTIHDMAYDPVRDEIVVPGWYNFSILTFSGDADGDVAPVRQIMGPRTQLVNPQAVSIDAVHGEIFVPQGRRILVFDRDAEGDVAPIRTLEGPDTGLGGGRITIDPVRDLMIVAASTNRGEGRAIRIFDRTASGNTPPLRTITGPGSEDVWLLTNNPENGMIFGVVRPGSTGGNTGTLEDLQGRYGLDDYVGVWSVYDDGDVPARWTIGGPNFLLKDARGIAIDVKNQNVMVSDKTLNAVYTFHVPEAFQ